MRLANICPGMLLEQVLDPDRDTYHVALVSQVLESRQYRDFYSAVVRKGHTVILRNDRTENGYAVSIADLRKCIESIWPSVVVLPDDIYGTGQDNYKLGAESATELWEYHLPYMAIPHGRNLVQYRACASQMIRLPGVTTLGISKNIETALDVSRVDFIRSISAWDCAFHLVGIRGDVAELCNPYLKWRCSGIDTTKFVQEGLRGNSIRPGEPAMSHKGLDIDYFKTPALDLTRAKNQAIQECIITNIWYWRRVCQS